MVLAFISLCMWVAVHHVCCCTPWWGWGCSRPNLLYVENPDCPELDVGRSSFMLPKIRRAFEHAHQVRESGGKGERDQAWRLEISD